MNTKIVQPFDRDTLLIYLTNNPRLMTKLAKIEWREYHWHSFKGNSFFFKTESELLTGPIPMDTIEFYPCCFSRRVASMTVEYHYTGNLPWLNEEERQAYEWQTILYDTQRRLKYANSSIR